jgi:hypothetical protein
MLGIGRKSARNPVAHRMRSPIGIEVVRDGVFDALAALTPTVRDVVWRVIGLEETIKAWAAREDRTLGLLIAGLEGLARHCWL